MKRLLSGLSLALLSGAALSTAALAQDAAPKKKVEENTEPASERFAGNTKAPVFELGEIVVYGRKNPTAEVGGQSISQSVVTADDIHKSNRNTLDDALVTTPGVEASNTGGSRNERLIYVRGFDRLQVPLYVDGVRVYLPADNRLDYGRFLTPDLSEIQIQKGYVSVLSGPGGMGGAINLVTRKPTKEFEGEIRNGVDIGNTGDVSAFTSSGWVGTRQEDFYLQASGSFRNSDGFFLSRKFEPVAIGTGGPVEDGGRRDFSDVQDWRANFKAGYTPNATDEYVISYTKQEGEKNAPYSIYEPVRGKTPTLPPGTAYQRDWTWPYWNIDSLAFNSNTAIGDQSYIKTKTYYTTFDNLLSAYDDSTFTTQAQTRAFDSYYKDHAVGTSIEAGTELIPMNTLKTALHFRRDVHNEQQKSRPDLPTPAMEPWQQTTQDTWSVALEDTFHATDRLDFVGGVSYERNDVKNAQEYNATAGLYEYPVGSTSAVNWQFASIFRQSDASEFHASVSSRTRAPTLFERYSTRFGSASPNPDLRAEQAINYELGWTGRPTDTLQLGGCVFYSDLTDVIQSIGIGGGLVQNQNIGDGRYYGFEVYGEWEARAGLTLGARYTYLKRRLVDTVRPGLQAVGTPDNSLYLYAEWMPMENLTISPNLEYYSSRWSTDRLENNFFQTGSVFLANLDVKYALNDNFSFDFGVRNIFDKDYQLAYGFPEPGRTFFLNSAINF